MQYKGIIETKMHLCGTIIKQNTQIPVYEGKIILPLLNAPNFCSTTNQDPFLWMQASS